MESEFNWTITPSIFSVHFPLVLKRMCRKRWQPDIAASISPGIPVKVLYHAFFVSWVRTEKFIACCSVGAFSEPCLVACCWRFEKDRMYDPVFLKADFFVAKSCSSFSESINGIVPDSSS
ncbi:hypothetical protein AYI68_g7168 [Smittium mucronatum]|uniref:Uncharacterized protein n=1 Tax=Smittium mucronatum TaxID=133383 RepID=A0A1R0GPI1_9FUNG|nr:hypothetical protein AYI68_g7168 [Smittium mucronatum]